MKRTAMFLIGWMLCIAISVNAQDMSAYAPKLAVGAEAPEIEMPLVGSEDVARLTDFRGHYVLVDFWATWCGDCRREMPVIEKAIDEYKEKIQVLSVSFDRKPETLKQFLEKNPMPWKVVADYTPWKESAVTKAYELNWIPTFYIVDPEGRIAGAGITGAELEAELARLFPAE